MSITSYLEGPEDGRTRSLNGRSSAQQWTSGLKRNFSVELMTTSNCSEIGWK